jgi:mono/diheme cytochrome c family protein
VAVAAAGCGGDPKHPGIEFMPDMYKSPSYETYQGDAFFADSVTALPPVAGTIPRGYDTHFPYPNTPEGYEAAGAALRNPFAGDTAALAEGRRLFGIYCRHCHGDAGDGKGTLRIKGEPFPVPSYFDNAIVDLPEGKMYFSITYGRNLMGPHATLVDPRERWKLVSYIKELQRQHKEKKAAAPADTTAAAG